MATDPHIKLEAQCGYLEVPQTGQEASSAHKPATKCPNIIYEAGLKCVCLKARSIANKKNKLNIVVKDIDPHIIDIAESWANRDIVDAELGLTG